MISRYLHTLKTDVRFILGWTLGLFAACQFAVSLGQACGHWLSVHEASHFLDKRVSLDLHTLDVGDQTLNTPVNSASIQRYLERMNTELETRFYPIRMTALENVEAIDADVIPQTFSLQSSSEFNASGQSLSANYALLPVWTAVHLSPLALLMAVVVAPLAAGWYRQTQQTAPKANETRLPITPRLVINLHEKTLGNGIDGREITLQNKPFCFYVGLLNYCINKPDAILSHHQEVPAEMLAHANKVFARLIDLGHTKRKRPDFSANLDKTLSEIRSVLDDVFASHPAEKERYYPPRAQGEGSRSKQHSYALNGLKPEDVEIFGH
ncbi:hypothetical protein DXV75_15975 [Alteromonas aestuariivivens]|uniref:Uncharacterized protein n=2 Tax=Alteromonas aestuariivivens TaxID=1938339 RepID=A0A3D8M340_9ALTE|nr:hypothetical protein DXV75_15975 [Alteromonas aestuariivivens]